MYVIIAVFRFSPRWFFSPPHHLSPGTINSLKFSPRREIVFFAGRKPPHPPGTLVYHRDKTLFSRAFLPGGRLVSSPANFEPAFFSTTSMLIPCTTRLVEGMCALGVGAGTYFVPSIRFIVPLRHPLLVQSDLGRSLPFTRSLKQGILTQGFTHVYYNSSLSAFSRSKAGQQDRGKTGQVAGGGLRGSRRCRLVGFQLL